MARKGYWCVKEWPVQWYSQVYECAMLAFVFVIPLAIMGFAYVSISMEMWRISSDRVELRANRYAQFLENSCEADEENGRAAK